MAEISGLFVTKKTHKKYLVLIYSISKLNSICVSFLSMPHIVKLGLFFFSSRLVQVHGWNLHDLRMAFFLFCFLFRVFFFASKETKNTGFLACGIKNAQFSFIFIFFFHFMRNSKVRFTKQASRNFGLLFFPFHESAIVFNGFLVGVIH